MKKNHVTEKKRGKQEEYVKLKKKIRKRRNIKKYGKNRTGIKKKRKRSRW